MKNLHLLLLAIATAVAINLQAADIGSAFTYQGRLNDGGGVPPSAPTGTYDFRFSLFDGSSNSAAQVGATVPLNSVAVAGGLFTAKLDFGASSFAGGGFTGADRWLEIAVRANNGGTNGNGNFSTLVPRQQLTPTPYALFAPSAGVAAMANGVSSSTIIQGQSLQVGVGNSLAGSYATISGGGSNSVNGSYAAILGGVGNSAISNSAAVGGGSHNIASGDHALVAGGEGNMAIGDHAFVGGGAFNSASGFDVVCGGQSNSVTADWAWLGGGFGNQIHGANSILCGGYYNQVSGVRSALVGGESNTVQAIDSMLGGGRANTLSADYGVLVGGFKNKVAGIRGVIGGGGNNGLFNDDATISGGSYNTNRCTFGTIGGGSLNLVQSPYSATVAGGFQNTVLGQDATIGGGSYNLVGSGALYGVIAGGQYNQVAGVGGAIGGGYQNWALGSANTISGGQDNFTSSGTSYSAIGGGDGNRVGGGAGSGTSYSAIGGGADNQIDSEASFAAIPGGFSAHAFNYGQHVFASGKTSTRGDAQSSLYVLRGMSFGSATSDLFLDGTNASKRINVPVGSVWTLRIQVAAVYIFSVPEFQRVLYAAYEASGVVANLPVHPNGGPARPIELHMVDGSGNTILTARPVFESTIGGDSAVPWQATPYVDTSDNTLRIAVSGSAGFDVKWTATIQTTEVLIP